jgi:hypothetical protein
MVINVIELQTPSSTLRLRVNDRGWCQVELIKDGQTSALGADTVEVVVERLKSGLSDTIAERGTRDINGIPVQWILSLAEQHCSLLAGDVGAERHIFFQGGDGKLIGSIVLSRTQREAWLRELRNNELT